MPRYKQALTSKLPAVLWHGSAFSATRVLKPGFLWTKKLVEWDRGESNHYLYASADRETAISLGFASAVEKLYYLDRYHTEGECIEICSPHDLTLRDLEQLHVWLYELHPQNSEQWVFNHNSHNGLDTEFKTHRIVSYVRREQVDLQAWLATKEVIIKKT